MPVGRSDGCTYRVVLIQPHDRRTGVVLNLHYVINRSTRAPCARSPPARLGLRADPDVQGDVREFAFFSAPRVYMTGVALDTHGERSLQTSWILKDTCLMLSVSPQHATKNCGSSRRRTPTWAASRVACSSGTRGVGRAPPSSRPMRPALVLRRRPGASSRPWLLPAPILRTQQQTSRHPQLHVPRSGSTHSPCSRLAPRRTPRGRS